MAYTTDRSFKAIGLVIGLGAALTIHGTMLWGFDGVATQAAASCVASDSATAASQPAALAKPAGVPGVGAAAPKAFAPA